MSSGKQPEELNLTEKGKHSGSQHELLLAILAGTAATGVGSRRSPVQILKSVTNRNESIETLAQKTGLTEREVLLAIRDSGDIEARKTIADALGATYYSIFGK